MKSFKQLREYRKYRVGGSPMPNPDKVRAADALRKNIANAQTARSILCTVKFVDPI